MHVWSTNGLSFMYKNMGYLELLLRLLITLGS